MMSDESSYQFTAQGRDTPVPVGNVGVGTGPARSSASDCPAHLVGNQADVLRKATGTSAGSDKKRLRLLMEGLTQGTKSAPVSPNTGVLDLTWDEITGRSIKKRKEEGKNGSQEEQRQVGKEALATLIRRTIIDLAKEVKRVASVAKERNTKKEVKEAAGKMSSLMSQLMTREAQELLQMMGRKTVDEEEGQTENREEPEDSEDPTKEELAIRLERTVKHNSRLKEENARLTNELRGCGGRQPEPNEKARGVSVGTQTNPRKADKIQTLGYVKSFEEWQAIADKQWDNELLSSVKIKEGCNLFDSEGSAIKLCWINTRENQNCEAQKLWRDRYPELMKIEGDFEVLEQITKLRTEGTTSVQKIIKAVSNGTEEEVWKKLSRVREELDGGSKVVMNGIPGTVPQRFRKLVAWTFREENIEVEIFMDKGRQRNENTDKTPIQPKAPRNTYAVIVAQKGLQYREVLERVKPALKDTTLAKNVKGLRSNREGGKLVITLEKDPESAEKIKDLLEDLHKNMDVRVIGDEKKTLKQVHIKGMDALTCKEEVLTAVEGKVGSLTGRQFRLSDLRPNINNTRAITLWIEGSLAEKLIDDGFIRVGMVNCRVEDRVNVVRCRRCWRYGHIAKGCNGLDLSKACYKCGQEGHAAKSCENEDECPLCQEKGHRADTGRCRIFQRALANARKRKQNIISQDRKGDVDSFPVRDQLEEEMELELPVLANENAAQVSGPIGASSETPND